MGVFQIFFKNLNDLNITFVKYNWLKPISFTSIFEFGVDPYMEWLWGIFCFFGDILFLSVWTIHILCFFWKAPRFTKSNVIKSWPVPAKQVGMWSMFIILTRGVTSEPLCEINFLNLWKYLWLHHLSGKMSLVSADLVILPPGHGSYIFSCCTIWVFQSIS